MHDLLAVEIPPRKLQGLLGVPAARQGLVIAALAVGYFGASTGGGAALVAASRRDHGDSEVAAVVSRGGRPDLAGPALADVRAPTLLVVGSLDTPVIELNRQALQRLRCEKELAIVPGAGHLFEEPGTLDEVVRLATGWFEQYLPRASAARAASEAPAGGRQAGAAAAAAPSRKS
jgi:putative phosphoribosyl transferase